MLRRLVLLVIGLGLAVAGCAREAPSARTPDPSFMPWVTPPGYAWPPPSVGKEDRMHPSDRALLLSKTDPITTANRPALPSDTLIPGGEDCLDRLRERGVRFEVLSGERGVETPILVHGSLGGVSYWSQSGAMVVDCRLALALDRVGPEFVALGVTRARFSGAYVYRTSRKGRLSLHAYGLAIDVHDVTAEQRTYSVKGDFRRGLESGCTSAAPLLNQLACRLKALGLFRELLTPDYNADHYDHLHLGIAPIPGSEARAAAASTPTERPSASQREVAAENGARKGSSEIKTAGQRVDGRAVHVEGEPTRRRVARLRADLEHLAAVTSDRIRAEASDEAR
jgi:hypothetical protein